MSIHPSSQYLNIRDGIDWVELANFEIEVLLGDVVFVSALGPSLVEARRLLLHFHWLWRRAFSAERRDATVSFGGRGKKC